MQKLNLINRLLLKAVLLPSRLYALQGADVKQLAIILRYKLMMDDRRPNTFQQTKSHDKVINGSTIGTMLLALVMGLLFITSFFVSNDLLTSFTIFFSMYIVMLALTLITDFTSVLIDARDNFIILPKPVSDTTFMLTRILHITIHVCKMAIPLVIPSLVTVAFQYNIWIWLVFLLMIAAATIFAIFLVNAVYVAVLKFSSPQRFKHIISYIQIAFTIVVYASYQVVPRLIDKSVIQNMKVGYQPYWLLLPSYWFACFVKMASAPVHSVVSWLAAVFAILLPVVSLLAVIKYFAPSFNAKLSMMASGGSLPSLQRQGQNQSVQSLPVILAGWVTNPGVERTGFLFSWKMMLRNRDFKMKVYPGIGYLLVLGVVILIKENDQGNLLDNFRIAGSTGNSFALLSLLYFTGLLTLTALQQSVYSEYHKASWMFRASPVLAPGSLLSGTTKAAIGQFQLPFFLLTGAFLLAVNGWPVIPHLLLAFSNLVLLASLVTMLSSAQIPWSQEQLKNAQSGTALRTIMLMLLLGLAGFLHGFLFENGWIVWMMLPVPVVAAWFIFRNLKKMTWKHFKAT